MALPILKVKLGDKDDAERVQSIRKATQAVLRVDANASWSLDSAKALLPILHACGVELLEQPLAVGDLEGLRALRMRTPRPPIFVDESIRTTSDIEAHAGIVDGVVIKLAKCGGIREAIRQIELAHHLGMRAMMGCMVESSVAVTAAATIAPLTDLVDLDTPLLIANDPFDGLKYDGARIILPEAPGLGLTHASSAVAVTNGSRD